MQIKLNGYKRIAIEVIARDEAKNDCNIPEIEITEQLPSGRRQVEQADVKIYFYPTDKLFPVRKKDKLFPVRKNIGRKIISGAKKFSPTTDKLFLFRQIYIRPSVNYLCQTKRANTLLSNEIINS